ncbi:hypothetical protein [Candidatus Vondammii sp. HM_W22]|uniref:hypothetical protein n=1 Tax=Candidatus Vondammii sp. HM_W22 TaxID=2687299 RepID=UPI001F13A0F7|nr:hypothetical protein [Candidatus Vondammii sp. HM_W22]
MPDYKVNHPVKVAGEIHTPGGKPITVDAETAAPAVASGALTDVKVMAPPGSKTKKPVKK